MLRGRTLVEAVSRRRQAEPREPDPGPTPETVRHHAMRRGDPIERLVRAGELDSDEERAARSIREVYERVFSDLSARGASMDGAAGAGSHARSYGPCAASWSAYVRVWMPWATWMTRAHTRLPDGRKPCLPMVLDIVLLGVGIDETRRARHMRPETVISGLRWSLRRYAEMARRERT